jgi:hypothetical protein
MKSPNSEVVLTARTGASTTYADKEASPQRAEVAYERSGLLRSPKRRKRS